MSGCKLPSAMLASPVHEAQGLKSPSLLPRDHEALKSHAEHKASVRCALSCNCNSRINTKSSGHSNEQRILGIHMVVLEPQGHWKGLSRQAAFRLYEAVRHNEVEALRASLTERISGILTAWARAHKAHYTQSSFISKGPSQAPEGSRHGEYKRQPDTTRMSPLPMCVQFLAMLCMQHHDWG